jgi:rhodanese-related sulfurtransferase
LLSQTERPVDDYFDHDSNFELLKRKELLHRARNGRDTILDVRPRTEYASIHLPIAKSIPLSELKSRLDELPKDQEFVTYCRGPYCVLAQEGINYLHTKGYNALRLGDGISEWRDAGLPLAKKE